MPISSMAKNAAARTAPENLSKLPDELLSVIISSLPMKDAVRSSVLSKRWRYLYASRSDLDFDFTNDSVSMDAVDRMLSYRKSCPINKFRIRISKSEAFDPCRLEGWIKRVICHGIRNISLSIHSGLVLPSNLFTCKTLVKLSLSLYRGPLIEVPAKVFLPSLKFLSLSTVISFRKDDDGVERLLSNCPALESFECCVRDTECRLVVSNPALKYLSVTDYRWSSEEIGSFEISINAPNLVSLCYFVFDVDSHRLINVHSLSKATVSFIHRQGGNVDKYALAATDLIRGISGVRELCIDGRFIEKLPRLNIPIPVFPNTTDLVIFHDAVHSFTDLLYVLTFFEALESLFLLTPSEFVISAEESKASEESRASCLSFRLKRVKLSCFDGKTCQMKMVEYFLENAKVLEVLETVIYGRDSEEELEISKELLMMPRASEKCKVVVTSCPNDFDE